MKNLLNKITVCMMLAGLSACSPSTNSPNVTQSLAGQEANLQRGLAVKRQFELDQRLINVAAPILKANTALCGKLVTSYIGAKFYTKDTISKDLRAEGLKTYGIKDNPTVVLIADSSPAVGVLQTGDTVTHFNGKIVPKGRKGLGFIRKALKAKKDTSAITLRLKRSGTTVDVAVKPVRACDSEVHIVQSDAINAVADSKSIGVTKGMMRFAANDTELATVIGHELAHNSRKHIQAKRTNAVMGTLVGAAVSVAIGVDVTRLGSSAGALAHSHGFETEADYVGLYHTARAGYDITAAPDLWRRMATENPKGIGFKGSSHPSTAKRFLTLDATVKEIQSKQEAGVSLIPEEKRAKTLSKETS